MCERSVLSGKVKVLPALESGGRRPGKLAVALAAWLTVVLAFYWYAESFALTPSKRSATLEYPQKSASLSNNSVLQSHAQPALIPNLDRRYPTLLIFLHPKCPCSRASVSELGEILSRQKEVRAYAIVVKPVGSSPQFASGELVDSVKAIPGLDVIVDDNDRIAHHFGVYTSGQVLLFGREGQCLFNGGITSARGHVGENVGSNSVRSLLKLAESSAKKIDQSALAARNTFVGHNAVFGCSLEGEQ